MDRSISGECSYREDQSNSLAESTIESTTASSPDVKLFDDLTTSFIKKNLMNTFNSIVLCKYLFYQFNG